MVQSFEKDGYFVYTIKPETKEEKEMLAILQKMDIKRQQEIDYWKTPKVYKQQTLDLDSGFVPVTDESEVPFE